MRTTIDLPDELYRTLKSRAALQGVTLRVLITALIEQGLRQPAAPRSDPAEVPLPVAIPPTGKTFRAFTNAEINEMEMEDERSRLGRSS